MEHDLRSTPAKITPDYGRSSSAQGPKKNSPNLSNNDDRKWPTRTQNDVTDDSDILFLNAYFETEGSIYSLFTLDN